MKKSLSMTLVLAALTTTCFAGPLTDYTQGKASIDLSIRPNLSITGTDSGGDAKWNSKSNTDFGLTYGLGNNFAIQYNYSTADTKDYTGTISGFPITGHGSLNSQEFNVLYKLDNNLSAFIGATRTTNDIDTSLGSIAGKSSNGYQVGFIDTTKIADKTNLYGIVAAGNKLASYTIGVSQALGGNTEFNLFYKTVKYKGLEYDGIGGYEYDYKVKGLGCGLTYKF